MFTDSDVDLVARELCESWRAALSADPGVAMSIRERDVVDDTMVIAVRGFAQLFDVWGPSTYDHDEFIRKASVHASRAEKRHA